MEWRSGGVLLFFSDSCQECFSPIAGTVWGSSGPTQKVHDPEQQGHYSNNMDCGLGPGFESQLCHLPGLASYLTSLSLMFLWKRENDTDL